jgi:hypothetical protein
MDGMRSRFPSVLQPVLLAAAWVVSLLSSLLSPQRALANRDIAAFHLPLRFAFRELAAFGLPLWNPWLHGGQPLLSNPSYGAFYPPSWLVLAVPPYYALSLLAMLHMTLAFAGAWHLARRLGCGRGAAALAGIGYSGCGAYLSQLSAYTLLLSLAWLPWLLAWADEALRAPWGERWWRPALLAGGALGLQLLNGEPSTAIMSGLALWAFAASAAGRQAGAWQGLRRALRVLVPFAFALALAAVQILPTLGRMADSPRRALGGRHAMHWSLPPQRLVEIVLPRFYGDTTRISEGLFFGGEISDSQYPYVESLYPGLLLAVLGGAALLGGRIPRRAAWSLAFGAGIFLALGRHNPLYAGLRRAVPVLAVLRYPEKFVILAVLALALAGVLGWQRLLDERQAGRPEAANLPLALSLAVLAAVATLTALLLWAPHLASPLLAGAPFPAPRAVTLPYLRGESWAALATAAAVAAFLGLCRWPRPSRRWLSLLAALLLAVDLWHYGHRLPRTVPAAVYLVPPPLAASLLPARDRVFAPPQAGPDLTPPKVANLADRASPYIARLTPYGGLLWRIPYAFDVDFDLMLTNWAQASEEILEHEWPQPARSFRYLGVWNVRTVLMARRIADQPPAGADPVLLGLSRLENSHVLPRFRFVPRVTFHPSLTAAIAAARAASWGVGREEHGVRPGLTPRTLVYTRPPQLLGSADEGKRVRLHYRADGGAFFVAATTFDEGWAGRIDGAPVAVYPTAACQLGVELPPGEHRLVLEYRDPFVPVGAAVSLFTVLVGALVYRRQQGAP